MATRKRGGARGRKPARLVGVAKELADARRRAEKADPRRLWSYARIASAAGVAPETVYRALTGKTKYPAEHIEARFRTAIAVMNEAALAQVAAQAMHHSNMGAGAACLQSGRRFIGSELDAEYCEVARARLQAEAAGVSLRDARAGQAGLFGGDS